MASRTNASIPQAGTQVHTRALTRESHPAPSILSAGGSRLGEQLVEVELCARGRLGTAANKEKFKKNGTILDNQNAEALLMYPHDVSHSPLPEQSLS